MMAKVIQKKKVARDLVSRPNKRKQGIYSDASSKFSCTVGNHSCMGSLHPQ